MMSGRSTSSKEDVAFLHRVLSQSTIRENEFNALWDKYDTNKNDEMDLKEVHKFTVNMMDMEMNLCRDAVQEASTGSKTSPGLRSACWHGVGVDKMNEILKRYERQIEDFKKSDSRLLFYEWDVNGDGTISKAEFKRALGKGYERWHVHHPRSWLRYKTGV